LPHDAGGGLLDERPEAERHARSGARVLFQSAAQLVGRPRTAHVSGDVGISPQGDERLDVAGPERADEQPGGLDEWGVVSQ
jgi:hypothetical protein